MASLSQILSHYTDISGREWRMQNEDYETLEFLDAGEKPSLAAILSHEAEVDQIFADDIAERDRFTAALEQWGMRGFGVALREAKAGDFVKMQTILAGY